MKRIKTAVIILLAAAPVFATLAARGLSRRGEFPLPPAPLCPRILYLLTQIGGQAFESQGFDILWRMRSHFYILRHIMRNSKRYV